MAKSVATNVTPAETIKYILIKDEKASGDTSGTFTAGDWRTRDLTVIAHDDTGQVSLNSNQFTLPAGTYVCNAKAPAETVRQHTARLQNITDGTTTLPGSTGLDNEVSGSLRTAGYSFITGTFTISAPKTFELQHQGRDTRATTGFGVRGGSLWTVEAEVYSVIEFWKTA